MIQAPVNVSTTFKTVIDIDEQNHIIELKFEIFLEWYELRARYQNLKKNPALNILQDQEVDQLWIPYLIFKVTLYRFKNVHINEIFSSRILTIMKQSRLEMLTALYLLPEKETSLELTCTLLMKQKYLRVGRTK